MSRRLAHQLGEWLPALVVLVAVIGAWQGVIAAFHIQQFLLPKPTAIASTFWHARHQLWPGRAASWCSPQWPQR